MSQRGLEDLYAASRAKYLEEIVPAQVASVLEKAEKTAAEASCAQHREYMPCPEVAYLVTAELESRGYRAEAGTLFVDLWLIPATSGSLRASAPTSRRDCPSTCPRPFPGLLQV